MDIPALCCLHSMHSRRELLQQSNSNSMNNSAEINFCFPNGQRVIVIRFILIDAIDAKREYLLWNINLFIFKNETSRRQSLSTHHFFVEWLENFESRIHCKTSIFVVFKLHSSFNQLWSSELNFVESKENFGSVIIIKWPKEWTCES